MRRIQAFNNGRINLPRHDFVFFFKFKLKYINDKKVTTDFNKINQESTIFGELHFSTSGISQACSDEFGRLL